MEITRVAAKEAMRDCWDRLYSVVKKFQDRLADPTAKLRTDHAELMVGHAVEMCDLLVKLNMTNDPDLENMRLDVKRDLCQYSPIALSEDVVIKETARQQADDILRRMDAFIGGKK